MKREKEKVLDFNTQSARDTKKKEIRGGAYCALLAHFS